MESCQASGPNPADWMSDPKDDRRADGRHAVEPPRDSSGAPTDAPHRVTVGRGRGVGRPSVVEPFRLQLGSILEADPRLKTVEVLHRMRQAGYVGGKSALYDTVRSLRARDVSPLAAFENLPGVLSQHDFGAVVIAYPTGRRERIHFFASRFKYSRYMDVRIIRDDGIETLIRSLLSGFEAFGGVPLMAVFDSARTVTLGQDAGRIRWDEAFGRVAIDYRFAPELRTPGGMEETGSAERLSAFVKDSFFKVRRFRDGDDILAQLADWHREVNTARVCGATGMTPFSSLAAERERLRPLAIPPTEYALRFPVVVGRAGVVEFQGHRYAMAPEAFGIPGLLWLYPETVRIVAGRHQSEHARAAGSRHDSGSRKHHSFHLARLADARGRPHIRRLEIPGPVDETSITEIVQDPRFTWKIVVE